MEIIPILVEGAIVCNVENSCKKKDLYCESCKLSAILLHNWLKATKLTYLILDFQDEKEICPAFLEELVNMRKRLRFPFLFSGAMDQSKSFLEQYNYGEAYPLFLVPEDAIRALRMQHPGLTETMPEIPIFFDCPLTQLLSELSPELNAMRV